MITEGDTLSGKNPSIIQSDEQILVTGAAGFVGSRVVENLLQRGFKRVRCFTRSPAVPGRLREITAKYHDHAEVTFTHGNLLSGPDCQKAVKDVALVFHLAAGTGGKSFPDAFLGSVVTTRNLLEAVVRERALKRFVNISSFAVYTNCKKPTSRVLDEQCPIEPCPEERDAYCYAKAKQDEIVTDYARKFNLGHVILRPGVVYGPGKNAISGRVGLGTFGIFLHLGGGNPVPLTYVDNCADAIVLAGITPGVEGETFNIVDDDLPSSRKFLSLYKKQVKHFRSISLPRPLSYLLCYLWEKSVNWSDGQLPQFVTRKSWHAYWKGTRYSNEKLKSKLQWQPRVRTADALETFFASCRNERGDA